MPTADGATAMSGPLEGKIKQLIRAQGPISVTEYFALCLADPEHGYYRTREPFGRGGDFITAPEVSQLFGEMIGIFLVNAWHRHGRPQTDVAIVEIGPGRGTMMADALRVVARTAPDLLERATIHLVETSERLQAIQAETLEGVVRSGTPIAWHRDFAEVPAAFTLMAANELFDAVPIRQFVRTPTGYRERMVTIDAEGELAFAPGVAGIDPALLPADAESQPMGAIFEIAPARQAVMALIASRLVEHGGTALAIDYGHLFTGFGDTLQGLRNHAFDPPLASPGLADLTSHVDFAALAGAARAEGAHVNGVMHQGDFLLGLGLLERAGTLGADKDEAAREAIRLAVERLAAPGAGNMGELFKVIAVSGSPLSLEPFLPPA